VIEKVSPKGTFDPEKHEYRSDGKVIRSVTQTLMEAGLIDTKWYTEHGRSKGSAVHVACQLWDEDDLDPQTVAGEVLNRLDRWMEFRESIEHTITSIEIPLYSATLAGTPDRIMVINGRETVVDIKNGAPQPWHKLQISGYRRLAEVDYGMIVYLSDNNFRSVRADDYQDWLDFEAAMRIANYNRRNKK